MKIVEEDEMTSYRRMKDEIYSFAHDALSA